MVGLTVLFQIQMVLVVFVLVIVWIASSRPTQDDRFVRFEAIEDICKACRELTDSGEVNYLTIDDIETIVDKLRLKRVVIESDNGAIAKKLFLAILVFMFTGFVGIILFIVLYKGKGARLVDGDAKLQYLRMRTLDWALYRFKRLADGGEVNYFSIEDIENVAKELRHEITNRGY